MTLPTDEPLKTVFVQNCNKQTEWLAIVSSDSTL